MYEVFWDVNDIGLLSLDDVDWLEVAGDYSQLLEGALKDEDASFDGTQHGLEAEERQKFTINGTDSQNTPTLLWEKPKVSK